MLLVMLSITKSMSSTMKAEYNKACEGVLYINTDLNLLQVEIIFQSSLKVGEFGRNTYEKS